MKCVYSYGGYAREYARLVRELYPGQEVLFIDDGNVEGAVSYETALRLLKDNFGEISVGFAGAALRRAKTEMALSDGFSLFSVQAATAIIGDNVSIGPGSIISDFAMITADARVGTGFQCNIYSYIAHDCVIGDYVTLAPRVSVNGRVIVENDVYIGTGATVLPGKADRPITIGAGAVIGAHALVTRDVPAGATVVGMPARQIDRS